MWFLISNRLGKGVLGFWKISRVLTLLFGLSGCFVSFDDTGAVGSDDPDKNTESEIAPGTDTETYRCHFECMSETLCITVVGGTVHGELTCADKAHVCCSPPNGTETDNHNDSDTVTDSDTETEKATADDDSDTETVIDKCPNDPNKTEPGICGCGVPDSDKDGDGVKDCNDTSGAIDDSFGVKGTFLFSSALGDDGATDAVTASDGSIFITGWMSNGTDADLLLMKLTSDGALDTSFNNGKGYITRHNIAGGNGGDVGNTISFSPDGDLLISGVSAGPGGYGVGLLWKVTTSGVYDTSFGTLGTYLLDLGKNLRFFESIYDKKTGKIFAVFEYDWLIRGVRILADGSGLDKSFSGDGIVELYPTRNYNPSLNALPDGTLMVAGICRLDGDSPCSWLIDTNGNVITSYTNYNDQTLVHNHLAGGWRGILPYPGNRLLLVGASQGVLNIDDELIARVNIADGSFDTSFGGGDGVWTQDVLGLGKLGRVSNAVVKQDGTIVAALEVISAAEDFDVAIIKLDADGVRDMSFASGTGILRLGGPYEDRHPNIIEQPDGHMLVVTSSYNETEGDIVVWAVL